MRPGKLAWVIALVILAVAAITAIGINFHQLFTAAGRYRAAYEGRVVDRSVTIRETEVGSYTVRRLLVREIGGQEFNAIVSEDVYEQAQVGMWIRRSDNGTELFWDPPQ